MRYHYATVDDAGRRRRHGAGPQPVPASRSPTPGAAPPRAGTPSRSSATASSASRGGRTSRSTPGAASSGSPPTCCAGSRSRSTTSSIRALRVQLHDRRVRQDAAAVGHPVRRERRSCSTRTRSTTSTTSATPTGSTRRSSRSRGPRPATTCATTRSTVTGEQAGEASALNANTSIGAGGHLYVGVGTAPSKSGSIGRQGRLQPQRGRRACSRWSTSTATPCRTRSSATAAVSCTARTCPARRARPGSRAADQPLTPAGHLRESSDTRHPRHRGLLRRCAAQLDYVEHLATTDRYFSDVNGDGITDLVNGSQRPVRPARRRRRAGVRRQPTTPRCRSAPVRSTRTTCRRLRRRPRAADRLVPAAGQRAPLGRAVRRHGPRRRRRAAGRGHQRPRARPRPTADGVRVAIQHEDTRAVGAADRAAGRHARTRRPRCRRDRGARAASGSTSGCSPSSTARSTRCRGTR